MNEQKVIDLCGDYPTDFSKVDVAINPGYVFQNDTSYSSVQLWDIEGNTVFVNSFLRCVTLVILKNLLITKKMARINSEPFDLLYLFN